MRGKVAFLSNLTAFPPAHLCAMSRPTTPGKPPGDRVGALLRRFCGNALETNSYTIRPKHLDYSALVERVVPNTLEPLGDKRFYLSRREYHMIQKLRGAPIYSRWK